MRGSSAKRVSTVAVSVALLVTMFSSVALAHECMVSNRSQNAEQRLAKSPMWLSENMATHESYEFVFDVVFGVEPTEEMLNAAVEAHIEQGLQEWASFFQGHTLLTNPKTGEDTPAASKHAGNGKGVDHWSDTELGQAMIAIAASLLPAA